MEQRPSVTTKSLIDAGNQAVHLFTTQLGYNNATFDAVHITSNVITLEFDLTDDFQEDLNSGERYLAGWLTNIKLESNHPIQEFWDKMTAWPTRAQRELHIMAGQLAKIGQSCDDMVTKQVEAFVNQIKTQQSDIAKLVHHG
jgi:hypothetical protein